MLSTLFLNILKPLLNLGSFAVFFLIYIFVCANFYLSPARKHRKTPFTIIAISGFNVSLGVVSLIAVFLLKETDSFIYDFIAKVGVFFFAAINIFLGIILIKIKPYAKWFALVVLSIVAILDIIFTLTTEHSKYILGFMGFYAALFTIYYFGLTDKYFRKNDENFSLRDDAAKKKSSSSLTDFFKE